MSKSKVIKTKHLWYCGCGIFLLGLILGAVIVLANFKAIMFTLLPKPDRMAESLADTINSRLTSNFDIPIEAQAKIKNTIMSSGERIKNTFEETRTKINALRDDLIIKISKEIPNKADREEFLKNSDKYFPVPPGPPPGPPPHGKPPKD